MKNAFLFSLIFLAVFAGCIQTPSNLPPVTAEDILGGAPGDPACVPPSDPDNPCMCNECKISILSLGTPSFSGKECIYIPCNEDDYYSLVNDYGGGELPVDGSFVPRQFAFGMGPDFQSFDEANKYCNYKMTLPVMWVDLTETDASGNPRALELPNTEQTLCYLDKQVIPLYILYDRDGISQATVDRTKEVAHTLAGIGPAYVATQPYYTGNIQLALVEQQVDVINEECPTCQIVLSAPHNSSRFLELTLGASDTFADKIDVVGLGMIIDAETAKSKECNPENEIYNELKFTKSVIMKKYHKPSIWEYFSISQGTSADGTCTLTENEVAKGYGWLYKYHPYFAAYGLIGVAHISYSDLGIGKTILPEGANAGLVDMAGNQKLLPSNAWFDWCKYYYQGITPEETTPLKGILTPAVYSPDGEPRYCTFAFNNKMAKDIKHSETSLPVEGTTGEYTCS